MRFIFISDTHSLHDEMDNSLFDFLDVKQNNILIHSGDCTNAGREVEVNKFVSWFQNLKGFDSKIFIAGNHDFAFQTKPLWLNHYINEENLSQSDCFYLEDNEFVILDPEFSRPIKIYGSPWQPWFHDWAFNLPRNGAELENKWKEIPNDTDILITHGPPFGYLDITPRHVRAGCEILINRVEEIKPIIHCFGHIHGGYGVVERNGVIFVNSSICDERYIPKNRPVVIDLNEINGEIVKTIVDI